MKMLKDTTFIKRCGLQRVVKCWKISRLLDAYFWKFWQFWTTSKIGHKIKLRYYLNCAYLRRSTVLQLTMAIGHDKTAYHVTNTVGIVIAGYHAKLRSLYNNIIYRTLWI